MLTQPMVYSRQASGAFNAQNLVQLSYHNSSLRLVIGGLCNLGGGKDMKTSTLSRGCKKRHWGRPSTAPVMALATLTPTQRRDVAAVTGNPQWGYSATDEKKAM